MNAQSHTVNINALIEDVETERNMMISVATGGDDINSVNDEYDRRRFVIRTALAKLGLNDPNPYDELWDWYGKWSSGELPTYASRRVYIRKLFAPLIEKLKQLLNEKNELAEVPLREPTGWLRVDRGLDKVRQAITSAKNEEDFQAVGLLCREILISLAQIIYDPDVHLSSDGTKPSETDVKRMLEAYLEKELPGSSNEAVRRYVKAALSLANDLQHSRTADFRKAAMCTEATTSVVNFIAIVSGRRFSDRKDYTIAVR